MTRSRLKTAKRRVESFQEITGEDPYETIESTVGNVMSDEEVDEVLRAAYLLKEDAELPGTSGSRHLPSNTTLMKVDMWLVVLSLLGAVFSSAQDAAIPFIIFLSVGLVTFFINMLAGLLD